MKHTVAFVPLKLNNERLPGKNTKPFTNGNPLITYILSTLQQVSGIDEICVYCSDESICDYLPENVVYVPRDKSLDQNSTKILEVLQAFAREIPASHYVLTHATAPFLSPATIQKGLDAVISGTYDSALSVTPCKDFLWSENRPLNYDLSCIPRTQDLKDLYIETTGLYIYNRNLILEEGRRTGDHPFLISVPREEAIDINDPLDFIIADAWYQHTQLPKEK